MGALLTGFLARTTANANLAGDNMKSMVTDKFFQPLVLEQLKAIGITLALAIVGTVVIAFIVKAVVGLDLSEHGEEGYHSEA
jgi:Amt family ammonium transporter